MLKGKKKTVETSVAWGAQYPHLHQRHPRQQSNYFVGILRLKGDLNLKNQFLIYLKVCLSTEVSGMDV